MKNFFHHIVLLILISSASAFAGINLNTASQKDLEALPGVGEKLASQIIAARPFKSVEDLQSVKGVGTAKFQKLKDLVSVDGAPAAAVPAAAAPVAANVNKALGHFDEQKKSAGSAAAALAPGQRVNLNTASASELEALPGIGKKKAEAIIAARPFSTPEDVMKVKGIKTGVFNKIKNAITVN